MAQIQHPFVVVMKGSFKDERFVFIVMEIVPGGELFTHLRRERKFNDEQSKVGTLLSKGHCSKGHCCVLGESSVEVQGSKGCCCVLGGSKGHCCP